VQLVLKDKVEQQAHREFRVSRVYKVPAVLQDLLALQVYKARLALQD
jgi:hypothetical protein